jgi:Protein of unknown function (DUF3073)
VTFAGKPVPQRAEVAADVREQPAAGYGWAYDISETRPDARCELFAASLKGCRVVSRRDAGRVCEGVDPMGRGRAKAKQTKVARDLKYRSHETDLSALAAELHGKPVNRVSEEADSDDDDEWAADRLGARRAE